ncbi:MAG: hypothetical protein VX693_11680 [Pseudomonadota bacterium]|nr:hypothetical protein [Pseudomonadota bacterium]
MAKIIGFLAFIVALNGSLHNPVNANKLKEQLRDHTFIYTDENTGLEHSIYIGRFGNNYDEYFPCEFVDGTWQINPNGQLCLKDRVDGKRRDGRNCLKPRIKNGHIYFFDVYGNLEYQSKLIKGNAMPLG